ncbi:flagellar motor switch protein FliN [Candidatus Odyssella thessalonicensis]|uniref:flagellar motor switch protein FliN n=1 Tax=Candidatus Odyssella thessalonicensis TaxID=84647 RepID=UPI000225BDB1|nr:flagellar motor switch protein FliN [Candidatus Odyssella thessalonicensis]
MNNDENLSGTSSPETEAPNEAERRADSDFSELKAEEAPSQTLGDVNDFSAVYNVPVQISAVLGRAVMPVSQLLKLGRGAVVELDRRVGESVDIYVNNRLVARGEVVIVDERLGITMTEIIKSER